MMEAYTSYKKSSVSWAPSIPSHWGEQRGKHLFALMNRPVEKGAETITCFRDGEVTLRRNRRTTGFTESLTEVGYQGIKKGDLVIHQMDAFAGAVGVSDSDGKSTPVYSVCQPKQELSVHYYAYLIREMARSQFILSLSRGIRQRSCDFRFSAFGQCTLLVPPLAEQQKIVDYLDAKCSEIDALVERRERIIEHLQELKQSIIAQAVTRGLNPEVVMTLVANEQTAGKWIGNYPAKWRLIRFSSAFVERRVKVSDQDYAPLSVSKGGIVPQMDDVAKTDNGDNRKLVQVGDFVINSRSDRKGSSGVSLYDGSVSLINIVLKPKSMWYPPYLHHLLRSRDFQEEFYRYGHGIVADLWTTRARDIARCLLPVPPIREQQRIAEFLDRKCALIDELVARHHSMIERLKELKTSLIAAAVTGKIDVR